MSIGAVWKKKKKPCCIANEKGFVSMYALSLLCIMISFASICMTQTIAYAALLENNNHHALEIAIIQVVKKHYENQTQDKIEEQEDDVEEEPTLTYDTMYHQGIDIEICYEESKATASYIYQDKQYQMIFLFDESHRILEIQYT